MTTLLRLTGDENDRDVVQRAGKALANGGLVAFPTETVYGLGANASKPDTIRRLNEVKHRPEGQPYTLLLADRSDVSLHVVRIPLLAQKMIDRFWPGPLTIVVPAVEGGTVGLRLPALDVTRDIIRESGVPVVAPSANPSGKPPATTAREAMDYFDGQIDLVVDGGATRMAEASAVIEFRDAGWRMLRSGVIDEDTVVRTAQVTILFVCTGNTCRSPMAAALCRKHLARRMKVPLAQLAGAGYNVVSAGTNIGDNTGASQEAMIVMRERGCDISQHAPRPLDEDLVAGADLIYVMSKTHLNSVLLLDPAASEKTFMLAGDDGEISDPYREDVERFASCADEIERRIEEMVEKL